MDDYIRVGIRARPLLERYTYRSRASYFMHLRDTKWVGYMYTVIFLIDLITFSPSPAEST